MFETTVVNQANDEDVAIKVEYEYRPGYPSTWEDPGEPEEIDIHSTALLDGSEIPFDLTDEQWDQLEHECRADHEERVGDAQVERYLASRDY